MAQIYIKQQTASIAATYTPAALPTLGSGAYCVSPTITHVTNGPLDVLIFPTVATTNTPTGNKQVVVFAQASYDGTAFTSGPTSGTTTTDEANLHYVGSIPLNTSSTDESKALSLAAAFGGTLPYASRLVFKNDCGVALTSASVRVAEVFGTSV
jgi:hypothetical protein